LPKAEQKLFQAWPTDAKTGRVRQFSAAKEVVHVGLIEPINLGMAGLDGRDVNGTDIAPIPAKNHLNFARDELLNTLPQGHESNAFPMDIRSQARQLYGRLELFCGSHATDTPPGASPGVGDPAERSPRRHFASVDA